MDKELKWVLVFCLCGLALIFLIIGSVVYIDTTQFNSMMEQCLNTGMDYQGCFNIIKD